MAEPHAQAQVIKKLIHSGKLDDYLAEIVTAIQDRRTMRGVEVADTLNIGDVIQITRAIKPKMLGGINATVTGFSGNLIIVNLLHDINMKWRSGVPIRLRASHIDRVVRKVHGSVSAS